LRNDSLSCVVQLSNSIRHFLFGRKFDSLGANLSTCSDMSVSR
jgi:hypothetical protein